MNIQKMRLTLKVKSLSFAVNSHVPKFSFFVNGRDERIFSTFHMEIISSNTNISFTFESVSLACACEGGKKYRNLIRRGERLPLDVPSQVFSFFFCFLSLTTVSLQFASSLSLIAGAVLSSSG
jgi:hypothetical protein